MEYRFAYHFGHGEPPTTTCVRRCSQSAQRLAGERAETIVAPDPMTYGSQAAAASQVFAQQRDLALRDRTDHQLELVDEALARLEAGTFGACVRCGRPIAVDRLEALPWAPRCIDCQRIADRER